jgi:hypothetical protein
VALSPVGCRVGYDLLDPFTGSGGNGASSSGATGSLSGSGASTSGGTTDSGSGGDNTGGETTSPSGGTSGNAGGSSSLGGAPDTGTGGAPDTGTGGAPDTGTGGVPDTGTGGAPDTGTGGAPDPGAGGAGGAPPDPPSCSDGIPNGDETGEDCGGSCTTNCGDGEGCAIADDCTSGICTNDVCEATGVGTGTVVTFGYNNSTYNGVVADAFIVSWDPTGPYENYAYLQVSPEAVSLVRFEVSALAPGTNITGASVLFGVRTNPATTGSVTLHELLEQRTDWETTWNERAIGVAWTTPGCGVGSRSATVLGRFMPYAQQTYSIPLPASLVQGWVDGPNYGLALVGDGIDYVDFKSAGVGSGVRPQLTVSYQ